MLAEFSSTAPIIPATVADSTPSLSANNISISYSTTSETIAPTTSETTAPPTSKNIQSSSTARSSVAITILPTEATTSNPIPETVATRKVEPPSSIATTTEVQEASFLLRSLGTTTQVAPTSSAYVSQETTTRSRGGDTSAVQTTRQMMTRNPTTHQERLLVTSLHTELSTTDYDVTQPVTVARTTTTSTTQPPG